MKNNRKPIFWRRGLALLLAVCLAAGYVPVPGYAEGCTHAHGEDCYEVTTQCVHSHDESCYTDPAIMEAGEEPDACAHVCAEETGCVTKALNCAHVHDSACGEAAEEKPKEEPEPQPEGKEEPKEEPKPEPQPEGKEEPEEEPKEEPEAPQEPQAKTVTAWTWLDEEEALDPETGKLCLVASEEAPVFLDQIMEVLPQAIEATVDGEGETLPVAAWTCGEYPEDGAYEGSFVLEAELPEGYALGDGVEALHVAVEFGGAVTLGENTVGVSLDGSWTSYATFDEAMRAVVTDGLSARSVEVKLYGRATRLRTYTIRNSMTLDLNGNRLEGSSTGAGLSVGGGTLTLKDSSQNGGSSNVKFETAGGRIQVDSGNWADITARNGNVTVDGGWVNKITAYDPVTLKGGKIDFLAVDKASVISLSYGTFEGIRGINRKVLAADLLAPGYAFRWDHDQKLQRYKDLPTLDDKTAIGNTTVVQCQSHVFENGNPNCIYCNTLCTHPTVNQTTGACESCGKVQYDAAVVTNPGTEQEQVTLYEKVSDAFAAADFIESLTEIRLLRDVTPEKVPLGFPCNTNLDGNGFRFCGGLGVDGDSPGSIENITLLKQSGEEISIQIAGDCVKLGRQCSIQGLQLDHVKTYDVVKDGFALYTDAQHTECADAATIRFTGTLYTGPHTHAYSEKNGSCACGKTAEAKVTSGGKTTFYESVRDAISAANAGGGVVTVFEDLWFPKIDRITGSMTIDLSGFTWYTRKSDRLFTVAGRDGTEVSIQNGRIESWNFGNGAVYLQSGSLVIEGTAVLDGYTNPAVTVTGGSLTLKAGAVLLHGLKAQSGHTIGEYLAPGTAYAVYDTKTGKAAEPLTLVDCGTEENLGDLVIVAHTHRFDANGKCQDCGYVCSHENVDMTTGKCAACSKQLYQAKIGTTGYATLDAALTAAQETENCTVTVLCDIGVPVTTYYRLTKGTVTLDLNGHKLADTESADGSLFAIDGADFTIKGTTAGSAIQEQRIFAITLLSGNLAIHGGSFGRIDWVGGTLTITDGKFEFLYYSRNPTATISGGTFQIITVDDAFANKAPSVWHTLKSGYAFFDVDSKKVVDASGQKLKNVYVSTHTHTKRQGYKTCACGYAFPYATVTKAPEPLKLTYTGQTQTLVTQGTAEGGEMLYSLEKDGYYGKTVPFGIVKTYTVYYMVRGDSGHLDTEPESVTVTIKPTKRLLDLTGLNLAGDITIDGVDYPIEASNDTLYVTIPETGDLFTYYGYKNIWASNEHSNYPTSMSVYAIERTPTGSTAREITELRDLLTYAGCSIRISGKQGIRMITALDEATKKALTGKGLAGYTLEEYGTVVSWTDALENGGFLRLGESYAHSNYAYRKGKADPVFARKNGIIQYTNVLVLENLTEADYDKDLTLRAYIRLRNTETGETVTLYGGTVTRSIYYVATQNADTYKPGTAGYKFVHKIIDAVENP